MLRGLFSGETESNIVIRPLEGAQELFHLISMRTGHFFFFASLYNDQECCMVETGDRH
jgi:hypothetical protein